MRRAVTGKLCLFVSLSLTSMLQATDLSEAIRKGESIVAQYQAS